MRRIHLISVKHLFGIFDYNISLNLKDRITIIHGPNGYGKTSVLKLVNSIFNLRYSDLEKIHFQDVNITFDNDDILTIRKTEQEKTARVVRNSRRFARASKFRFDFEFYVSETGEKQTFSPQSAEDTARTMAVSNLGLYPVGANMWRFEPTGEMFSEEEIFERFGELFPGTRGKNTPDWLSELCDSITVRFIQSQRLLRTPQPRGSEYSQKTQMVLAVTTYAQEIAGAIQVKLAEYAALSQSLDRTFPTRLVKERPSSNLTSDQLRNELSALESKRARLRAAGLLDQNLEEDFQVPEQIDDATKGILSIYISDVEQKLSVFNEIADKIDLLTQIVNDHFRYKRMSVDKEKGFTFSTLDGKPLSPEDLSTGEQHELILLYESLFKVKPGSLILIDEPEISLHVEWQVQFLEDLQKIIRLAKSDVLIATHSPQIINDRWDLTVDLEEMVS